MACQVAGGERDHREAQEREERQRDAREDLLRLRVGGRGEQPQVQVADRRQDEDGEDGQQHEDDPRLDLVHGAWPRLGHDRGHKFAPAGRCLLEVLLFGSGRLGEPHEFPVGGQHAGVSSSVTVTMSSTYSSQSL